MKKNVFLAFETSPDEENYGEEIPVASVVRLTPERFAEMNAAVAGFRTGVRSHDFTVPAEDIRWLKRVAFTPQGGLADIPDFFTSASDALIASDGVLNMELDGDMADFADECTIYTAPMQSVRLNMNEFEAVPHLGVLARIGENHVGSMYTPWSGIELDALAAFNEAASSAEQVAVQAQPGQPGFQMDHTDQATIIPALTFYKDKVQGDPYSRSDRIHALATGDDKVVSMDDEGLADLLARVRATTPVMVGPAFKPKESDRKFFVTEVKVTVLTEDNPLEELSLSQLAFDIVEGGSVGTVEFGESKPVPQFQMARLLEKAGREPSFFQIDGSEQASVDRPRA
jgi:hypothetical protein